MMMLEERKAQIRALKERAAGYDAAALTAQDHGNTVAWQKNKAEAASCARDADLLVLTVVDTLRSGDQS